MTRRLNTKDAGFELAFLQLLGDKREQSVDVNSAVASILDDVRKRGDVAVREYTRKFDGFDLPASGARISSDDIARYAKQCEPSIFAALEQAASRIRSCVCPRLAPAARASAAAASQAASLSPDSVAATAA